MLRRAATAAALHQTTRREFLAALAAAGFAARPAGASPQGGSAAPGTVRTVAGIGRPAAATDDLWSAGGADALGTPVTNPFGIVTGPDGALYFCELDTGCTRRFDLAANRITTIAGNGQKGYAGDGGPALEASFTTPHEIRFDRDGHLFIVERDSHVVRRVDAKTRRVSTVAGTGTAGFSGDGGPAAAAQLRQPHSIAFDAAGDLLICDIGNRRIRRVDMRTGIITTHAGTGERGPTPDEAPLAGTPLNGPRSIDTDPDGNVYLVLREGNAVFRIDAKTQRLSRLAGTGATGFTGDGGNALAATFNGPKGIAYSGANRSVYVIDTENHAVRRVELASGLISTVLGDGQRGDGPDGNPLACRTARPHGVVLHQGMLYVTDSENHKIRAVAL
jgi:DNA-binding beta-propeller fold protein YncE